MNAVIKAYLMLVFFWCIFVAVALIFSRIYVVIPYRVISTWMWTECQVRSVSQVHIDYGVFNNKIRSWFVPCPPPPSKSGKGASEDDHNNDDVYLSPCFIIKVDYKTPDGHKVTSAFLYRDVPTVNSLMERENQTTENCTCFDKDFSDADSEATEFATEHGLIGKTFDFRYNPDNLSQTLLKGPNITEAISSTYSLV